MTSPTSRPGRGNLDKPRRARVKVDLWCDVDGSKSHAHAHLRNLTVGGCRLLSPCAFPKGEVLDITVEMPPNEPDLKVKAEVRWLGLNPDEGPFVLGCRFVHSEETTDRVDKLLRKILKKMPQASVKPTTVRRSGTVDLVFASEGLARLLRPGLSATPPGAKRP